MRSVGGQGKVLLDKNHQHHETMAKFSNVLYGKQDDWSLADELISDNMTEDEFVDAEDGYDKADWRHDM